MNDAQTSKNLLRQADELARDGKLQQAIELYQKAIFEDRKNYTAYYNKGVTHMELGQYKKAADEFAYYLSKVADDVDAWLNFAVTLNNLHRFKDALVALQNCPEDADVEFNRGIALHSLRRYEEAELAFRRAEEIDPQPVHRYYLANLYADMDRFEEAIDIYSRLLEEDVEEEEDVRYNLANCLVDAGETSRAIEQYKIITETNPENWKAQFNLAYALEEVDLEESIRRYEIVIEKNPDLHEAHYNLACVLARHRRDGWEDHLSRALEMSRGLYLDSLTSDPDFDHVRKTPYFQWTVEKWKKNRD